VQPVRLCNQKRQDCSMRSFKKTTRHVCIFYFSSVKYQFYIHVRNKYQLGGSSTRLPIGSSPMDPTGWLPSPGYLPLWVNPPPPKLPSRWSQCSWLFLFIKMSKLMSDDDEETVILASATILFSSCALFCNNKWGIQRKVRHSGHGSRLAAVSYSNTALTTA